MHYEKNEYSSAEVYLKKAVLTARNLADAESLLLESMNLLSHVLIERNSFDEAVIYAEEAIQINNKMEAQSTSDSSSSLSMELAFIIIYAYKHKKDYAKALEWMGKYFQMNSEIKAKTEETQEQEA